MREEKASAWHGDDGNDVLVVKARVPKQNEARVPAAAAVFNSKSGINDGGNGGSKITATEPPPDTTRQQQHQQTTTQQQQRQQHAHGLIVGEQLDTLVGDIQPMPESTCRVPSIPGAFAVVTCLRFHTGFAATPSRSPGGGIVVESAATVLNQEEHYSAQLVAEDDAMTEDDRYDTELGRVGVASDDIAVQVMPQEETKQTKTVFYGIAASTITIIFVILMVALIHPNITAHDADTTSRSGPEPSVTFDFHQPFQNDLPASVTAAIQQKNEKDPFFKANRWVVQDPHMDTYSPERQKQRFYLAMFYYATNGDNWIHNDHWLSYNVSECQWYSSSSISTDSVHYEPNTCEYEDGESKKQNSSVISLSLASNNLTGTWPLWYTYFLPTLRILDLGNNNIGGPLPTVTTTPLIEVIILSNNPLSGIPSLNAGALFNNLKVLKVDGTKFRGNNGGAFLAIVPNIEIFNMTAQFFDGQIWPSFGRLTHMEYLGHGHTMAYGTIPSELGLVTSLKEVDLSTLPNLYGTLPSELGLLTELTMLDLLDTPITGVIPAPLCDRVGNGLLDILANCSLLECCIV